MIEWQLKKKCTLIVVLLYTSTNTSLLQQKNWISFFYSANCFQNEKKLKLKNKKEKRYKK